MDLEAGVHISEGIGGSPVILSGNPQKFDLCFVVSAHLKWYPAKRLYESVQTHY